jgi:hypothetical protein
MKRRWYFPALIGCILLIAPGLMAEDRHGMSFNGSTGLYSIPSGHLSRNDADLALDLGLTYNFVDNNPIAKIGFSLFKWVEVTAAVDFQPRLNSDYTNTDIITGLKVRLPTGKTAVAVGGNLQFINRSVSDNNFQLAGQIYAAASYPAQIFGMPMETSLVLGYTFHRDAGSNIDFGMGFDMILLPKVFKRYVHWIADFSNFSYSIDSLGSDPWYRGAFNTGLRIDLAAMPALSKFKFFIDVIATDVFDRGNRAFLIGAVFGLPLK